MQILTIGHSTLPIQTFLEALTRERVSLLVDVRRFPGSRRHPQFNGAPLARSLAEAGIDYLLAPDLGGRRAPRADSPHSAWRHPAFRGYADHMDTPAFRTALSDVLARAAARRVALMCAERHWSQCHRGLIADYMKATGVEVLHITAGRDLEPHPYTAAARIVDGRLSYGGLL
jgi:uncharacterized protein (DUF488 family)